MGSHRPHVLKPANMYFSYSEVRIESQFSNTPGPNAQNFRRMATYRFKNWILGSDTYHDTVSLPKNNVRPVDKNDSNLFSTISEILHRAESARQPRWAPDRAGSDRSAETIYEGIRARVGVASTYRLLDPNLL
jgi:hypothetical protein